MSDKVCQICTQSWKISLWHRLVSGDEINPPCASEGVYCDQCGTAQICRNGKIYVGVRENAIPALKAYWKATSMPNGQNLHKDACQYKYRERFQNWLRWEVTCGRFGDFPQNPILDIAKFEEKTKYTILLHKKIGSRTFRSSAVSYETDTALPEDHTFSHSIQLLQEDMKKSGIYKVEITQKD